MKKCECSLSISLTGDGCRYCQPQDYIDKISEWLEDTRKENEQLQAERDALKAREAITWIDASSRLPDDNTTVMLFAPDSDEPVWLGYYEDDTWYVVCGNALKPGAVTHWSTLPAGPEAAER